MQKFKFNRDELMRAVSVQIDECVAICASTSEDFIAYKQAVARIRALHRLLLDIGYFTQGNEQWMCESMTRHALQRCNTAYVNKVNASAA